MMVSVGAVGCVRERRPFRSTGKARRRRVWEQRTCMRNVLWSSDGAMGSHGGTGTPVHVLANDGTSAVVNDIAIVPSFGLCAFVWWTRRLEGATGAVALGNGGYGCRQVFHRLHGTVTVATWNLCVVRLLSDLAFMITTECPTTVTVEHRPHHRRQPVGWGGRGQPPGACVCARSSGPLGMAAFFRGSGRPAPWLGGSGAQPPQPPCAVGGG